MKKLLLIIYVILLGLFIDTHNVLAQDRNATYVAGLTGQPAAWATWQALFNQERRMALGSNGDYTAVAKTGIHNFALQVPTPGNNNTIFFGNSTGGVVGRHLNVNAAFTNKFGGIITTGAQLDGARIANNTINGQAANFIVDGAGKALRGPIRQLGPVAGIVYAVSGYTFKFLVEDLVGSVLLEAQGGATTTEVAEGSAYMNNGYRATTTATPKIHIYGNENSPVFWRTVSSFDGKSDDHYVTVAQQAYNVCSTAKSVKIALGIIELAALNFVGSAYSFWVADGWADGANWFNDGSERGWNDLIGSSIPATMTTSAQVLDYNQLNQCLSYYEQATYEQYMYCQQQSTYTVYYTFYSPVNGLSDGLIKAPSATGYYSAWSGNATKIEALGVNHREMREHAEMRDIYNRIFNGQVPGQDPFFTTAIR